MLPLLLLCFACTFGLTIALVPPLARWAIAHGLVDKPNARKVHALAVPRIGGVAIFLSFYCTLPLLYALFPTALEQYVFDPRNVFLILGSLVAFGVGLVDDFKGLRAKKKLYLQLVAAGLAYLGGIRIESIGFYTLFQMDLGWLSPVISIFWMVLVINAFNLIDGLDGLAGGVGVVACAFLGYVCFIRGNLGGVVFMVAIAGSLIGFLRYNFHPASVFMGDGGSYFLGYLLGTVSTFIAMTNTATLTTLIPMLVVALPVIDVSIATMRRFAHGRAIFSPDRKHFHHMLLRKGLSHRNAVFVLWGMTVFIGCCGLAFLRIKDEKAYVLLILLGASILYGIAKLGYFNDYDLKAVLPWLNGISDEVGLSRERRSFFDIQTKIGSAQSLPELWMHVERAAVMLEFMIGAIYLQKAAHRKKWPGLRARKAQHDERRNTPALYATVAMRQSSPDWYWCNPEQDVDQHSRSLFRVEMDMQSDDGYTFGTLLLIKNQAVSPVSHYTLKRIEHLKRSIVKALSTMEEAQKLPLPVCDESLVLQLQHVVVKKEFEKLKN